jgi:hypothetical protein
MEVNLLQRRKVLEEKIPEIEKTIAMVDLLTEKKDTQEPLYTDFELNDTLYAKAKIQATGSVYLWLGVKYLNLFCSRTLTSVLIL